MLREGTRMVYYTSAATAIQILRNHEIWMRSTQIMNDFMEVEHGIACVEHALQSESGRRFQSLVNTFYPGVFGEVVELFRAWVPGLRADTFLACVSEHPQDENAYGRLSMWRAYGGSAGVALVLNPGVFFRPSDALAAYSMPVAYFAEHEVAEQLGVIADGMTRTPEVVGSLGATGLRDTLFEVLRFAAVCTKHPAFKEEREWRVVASPAMRSSPLLRASIEAIGGVPQMILKLPLKDEPERGLVGIAPDAFIERVLIGPCEHPNVLFRALWSAMEEARISEPATRLVITGIPLRANQR